MHTSNVWFVALCYAIILICYATTIFAATHNSQHFKPKASFQGQAAEIPATLGKSWGWKKQQPLPQNNFIIITRPATSAALAISPATLTTSPVAITSSFTTPTTAQVVVRQGNYRNRNRNRNRNQQNQRNSNKRYRNRYRNRNGNWSKRRQRPLGNGVYYAREENDNDNNNDNDDVKSEEMKNNQGVNSKLDIEQLEKSLGLNVINHNKNKQINENNRNDYMDDIVVSDEVADATVDSQNHRRRISKPQATETFSPAVSTAISIEPIITTRTSKLPTYAMAANTNGNINNNNNNSKKDDKDDGNNKRQTIWQGLTKRWQDRRKRRRNENNNNNNKPKQQQEEENIKNNYENEHEIIIDENGKIHLQTKRKKQSNNNNIKDKKIKRQQEVVKLENESQAADVEDNQQEINAMNSLINDNNTNSRLQNIIKAFRLRTPIIYKNQY